MIILTQPWKDPLQDDDGQDGLFLCSAAKASSMKPTSGGDKAYAVPLLGSQCPCRSMEHGAKSTTSCKPTCLPLCIAVAREVCQLWEERNGDPSITVNGSGASRLEAFLKQMISIETQAKWETSPSETWNESEALEHFVKVEDTHFRPQFGAVESFLKKLKGDSEPEGSNSPSIALVRDSRTAPQETLLIIRLQSSSDSCIYAIFDTHFRSDTWETRGPACVFVGSSNTAAQYLFPIISKYWLPETGQDAGDLELSGVIMHHRVESLDLDVVSSNSDPVPTIPDSKQSNSSNPLAEHAPVLSSTTTDVMVPLDEYLTHFDPPATVSTEAPTAWKSDTTEKQDTRSVRNTGSHSRLNQEFGWQMSLQNKKVIGSTTPNRGEGSGSKQHPPKPEVIPQKQDPIVETPTQPLSTSNDGSKKTKSPRSAPRNSNFSVASEGTSRSSKVPSSLAKKDIGWQLALQMVQEPPPPPAVDTKQETDDDSIFTPPKPFYSSQTRSSTTSVDSLGVKSGRKPRETLPQASTSSFLETANTERQSSVRGEFGWQLGLAAQSYTFPLSQTASKQITRTTSNSEWGILGTSNSASSEKTDPVIGASITLKERKQVAIVKSDKDRRLAYNECGRCFDLVQPVEIVQISGCRREHQLCHRCVREHILTSLEEGVFPIPCPLCLLHGRIERSPITVEIMDQVGFSQREIEKFCRLELASDNFPLRCPRCNSTRLVNRDLNTYEKRGKCPGTCEYEWCKSCRKPTKPDKEHLCVTKFGAAVKRSREWRSCPGCALMIQRPLRPSNHIECPTPGCRYHFCYKCGDLIADGLVTTDVISALAAHNKRCGQEDKCLIQ